MFGLITSFLLNFFNASTSQELSVFLRFINLLSLKLYSYLFLFLSLYSFSQKEIDFNTLDENYREDQFYLGATLNFLTQTPSSFSQNGLSGGFHFGFIRDVPFNAQRNLAFGFGLGYSLNRYNTNLFVGREQSGNHVMLALDQLDVDVDKNYFVTHVLEVPLQFRWRTSTSDYQKFYRIYAGLNLGYTFNFYSYYRDELQSFSTSNPSFLNRFRTGAHLALGHGFINFYIQYYFDSLLTGEVQNSQEQVNLEVLKFGLIFYIL